MARHLRGEISAISTVCMFSSIYICETPVIYDKASHKNCSIVNDFI